ncbi:hypothetical protein HPP92_002068 [Vanilla planifolia]|uniref:Uncharacterized protein n=1 Tax=Vanilla planifolia TaxID=51239 RepID=A0A835S128_VANPL|nr:hypothetical protein HPP92_002068 [Vanilla planifolia]
MGRPPACDEKGLKKGPWTPEEDQKLVHYIQKHGHGSWRDLPMLAGLNRCGKSCRLRWTNYLKPDIKRGKFSLEEEQTILNLHSVLGNKWSAIASHLPGRTDNEIKNLWNTHLKKKLIQMGFDPATHRPRTDFFAALPHLLALANLIGHCGTGDSMNNLFNLRSSPSSSLHSMNDLPVLNSQSASNQPLEMQMPSSYEQPLINNETSSGFGFFCREESSSPPFMAAPALSSPLMTDLSNVGEESSTLSCGGGTAASFWPDFLLDDPYMPEFA